MDSLIKSSVTNEIECVAQNINGDGDSFTELEQYLEQLPVPYSHCPDVIAFWGVSVILFCSDHTTNMGLINLQLEEQYPVVHMMAHDYMAIPGSTCLAEWSFSMSAWTDDARRHAMHADKFGGLQRLKSAYQDGCLQAQSEAWLESDFDMNFNIDTDSK